MIGQIILARYSMAETNNILSVRAHEIFTPNCGSDVNKVVEMEIFTGRAELSRATSKIHKIAFQSK